jgi:hypothetical protein
MSAYQSSCLCGANVITYTGTPAFKFKCHCTDERKLTGAAPFSLNYFMDASSLKIVSGTLSTWTQVVNSRNDMTNHCCGKCGGLLYRTSTGYPGMMAIKVGCIDTVDGVATDVTKNYVPDVEIFTRTRVPWVPAVEGAKQEIADFT